MANNGKKEFPVNGLEHDCTSEWGRKHYAYVNNISGIKKYVKNQLNRRFRRRSKKLSLEEQLELELHYKYAEEHRDPFV